MPLVELIDVVGYIAVFATILQFLAGVLVCKQYVSNQTTGESTPLPFTCGIISCALWFSYGVIKKNDKVIFVNVIGIILMSVYTAIFFNYSYKKSAILRQIIGVFICLFTILGFVTLEEDIDFLLGCLGQAASIFTLMMIGAPLSKLLYVMKSKTTECLPFPMIMMSFIVSSLWFVYGMLDNDLYILVPNIIGAMLAFTELSLFLVYPSNKTSKSFLL